MLVVSVAAAFASEKVKPVSESTMPTARASRGKTSGDGRADAENIVSSHSTRYEHGILPRLASAVIPYAIRISIVYALFQRYLVQK
jgi:hypothetical protein